MNTTARSIAQALTGGPTRLPREWDVVGTDRRGEPLSFTSTHPRKADALDLSRELNEAGAASRVVLVASRRLGDPR